MLNFSNLIKTSLLQFCSISQFIISNTMTRQDAPRNSLKQHKAVNSQNAVNKLSEGRKTPKNKS
jgi:hypothetical protein